MGNPFIRKWGTAAARAVAAVGAIVRAAQARARRGPEARWTAAGGSSRGWWGVAFWYLLALFGSWGAVAH